MPQQPLIIKDWQNAIGKSPNVGFGIIRNASIDSVDGAIMPGLAPVLHSPVSTSRTFTWNLSGTEDLTTPSTVLETDGIAVTFSTTGGGTLDTNVIAGTIYYLYKFASGRVIIADTLAHAFSHNNMALNGDGTGTCTVTTVTMGTPSSIADGGSATYFVDSNGIVWYDNGTSCYVLSGNTTTQGSGQGIAYFTNSDASKNFIFVFRNQKIDVADVTTQYAPVWSNSWQSMNNGAGYGGSHNALLGQDNIIYACDGRYVVSIQEKPGSVFDPGTAGTYTYNARALTLPVNDAANWLEQLGVNLLVAGSGSNLIYPWDRVSPSFALPILCPEIGVYRLKNIGNTVFICNGLRGNIYKTLGYSVSFVTKIPEYISGNGSANIVQWGGISTKNGGLLVGVTCVQLSTNSGIFLVYPDGRMVIDCVPTTGAAAASVINNATGEFYKYGYPGGFDGHDTNRYDTLGNVTAESALYTVGTKTSKAKYSQLEVQLDGPGASGGSVRISYRFGLKGSYTTLATYTLDGTVTSFNTDIGLTDIENIQVQTEVSGRSNSDSATRVREVRLNP